MKSENSKAFENLQSDFFRYMVIFGGITPKTSSDYVTRLKFLSQRYCLDKNITNEYIEYILSEEEKIRVNRSKYSSRKSISDFRSGLRKFLAFVTSDYHRRYEESILSEVKAVEQSPHLNVTEKTSIVQSRVGQGLFRNGLIRYWNGCAVSGFDITEILVASHIKPWRVSDNNERLDIFNGLLLLPNYDKLFDLGYITFKQNGDMVCSKLLPNDERKIIGINQPKHLLRIDERHKPYLNYHNENCFIG